MKSYEGVFILDPDMSSESSKGTVNTIQELILKNGGRVDGLQEWGKKRMAYKIRKKSEGYYVIFNFQMDPKESAKFDQSLRLNDNIIRFLIIKKDEL